MGVYGGKDGKSKEDFRGKTKIIIRDPGGTMEFFRGFS